VGTQRRPKARKKRARLKSQNDDDHREQDRAQANPRLETRVHGEDTPPAIDIPPDPETAHRKSGHERREDCAHGEDRIAEQQMEHAGPRYFVEQTADAGQEAEDQDDATPDPEEESGRDNRHGSIQVTASREPVTVARAPSAHAAP